MKSLGISNAEQYKRMYRTENKTQCEMIAEYMNLYGSITPLEALIATGSMRLSARVFDLKREGYHIGKHMTEEGYAEYFFID